MTRCLFQTGMYIKTFPATTDSVTSVIFDFKPATTSKPDVSVFNNYLRVEMTLTSSKPDQSKSLNGAIDWRLEATANQIVAFKLNRV